MAIQDLLKIQQTYEFEEFGNIDLVRVKKDKSNLELKSQIFTGVEDGLPQLWKITCHEVREHKITLGEQDEDFQLFNDHVLLWSYNQPVSSLTFNKVNSHIDACYIIGKLYKKHTSLLGLWIPFNSYFNQCLNLEQLINSGHGKLAEGAEKIIIGYQEVLQECGFKASYLSRPPKRWDNKKGWIDENGNLQVLTIGFSYVVASDFTAEKISNKDGEKRF